ATLTTPPVSLALGRCEDPWGTSPGLTGKTRAVHPDRLRERFARSIAARDWATVFAGVAAVIDTTLDKVAGSQPSSEFNDVRRAFRTAADSTAVGLVRALQRPKSELAAALSELDINQFRPLSGLEGNLIILQSTRIPNGVPLDSTKLSADQLEAVCWSGWSLHRLLSNVNFETIPGALARIESQEQRWERYRTNGPMQLPHEMAINRVRRFVFKPKGSSRFNPPRFDLVAAHPFAGLELVRTDDGVKRSESIAAELGGATLWVRDWKQHIGASWVLAYDSDGRIGRGPLVRLGGYVTAGMLSRRDAGGKSRKSLLINIDALRLLKPDAVPQAVRQAQSIAGEVLDRLPQR
ncbi:MAG TPA: hypothetical protein VM076_19535, partial [Gemmatimonadaceae bacterium]|nr:hypothetical protein [Gemmatimonadaceae bacterium]